MVGSVFDSTNCTIKRLFIKVKVCCYLLKLIYENVGVNVDASVVFVRVYDISEQPRTWASKSCSLLLRKPSLL